MKLRLLDYLADIKEFNGVSLCARLQCTCGSTEFEFSHTGKQTKGIFAPFIIRKRGQLVLKALCPCCHNPIVVYDSEKDGAHSRDKSGENEFLRFVSSNLPEKISVVIKYNYFPENFKAEGIYTNRFENCFIYVVDEDGREGKALIEE